MKDLQLQNKNVFFMVKNENIRQLAKWGIQDKSPFEWLTYTAEELGETAKAISEHHYRGGSATAVVKEAIQTATLALKIAEMYLCEAGRIGEKA